MKSIQPAKLAHLTVSRASASAALVIAGWPVLRWYIARMTDGSDEPLGALAMLAAAWFARGLEWKKSLPTRKLLGASCFLAALIGAQTAAPPLVRALFWLGAVAVIAAPMTSTVAWSGLLVLSLPVMASLQFFLGYPVRVGVTWAAAGLLRLLGQHVIPTATVLNWGAERVLIDAPCSGLQMAWVLTLITLVVAVARTFDARETFRLLRFSAGTVWVANVLRASFLFLLETRARVSASWVHDTVGIALFAVAVLAVLWRSERLRFLGACSARANAEGRA